MAKVVTNQILTSIQDSMREVGEEAFTSADADNTYQHITSTSDDDALKLNLVVPVIAGRIDRNVEETFIAKDQKLQEAAIEISYENDSSYLAISRVELLAAGVGSRRAAVWARSIGRLAANLPNQRIWEYVLSNPTTGVLDGQNYFDIDHLLNPKDSSKGSFANVLTSVASGAYPGAVPITGSDLQVAADNLAKAIGYIRSLLSPDGITPARIRPRFVFCAPQTTGRVSQLLGASFLNMNDAQPGSKLGLVPVEVPELAAAPTTYYIGCESASSSDFGAFHLWTPEPFNVTYYGPMDDASLQRIKLFEWFGFGRQKLTPGDYRLMFKCMAT